MKYTVNTSKYKKTIKKSSSVEDTNKNSSKTKMKNCSFSFSRTNSNTYSISGSIGVSSVYQDVLGINYELTAGEAVTKTKSTTLSISEKLPPRTAISAILTKIKTTWKYTVVCQKQINRYGKWKNCGSAYKRYITKAKTKYELDTKTKKI